METVQAQCKCLLHCRAQNCQVLKRPAARKWGQDSRARCKNSSWGLKSQNVYSLTSLAVSEVAPEWPIGTMMKHEDKTSNINFGVSYVQTNPPDLQEPSMRSCQLCQERPVNIGVSDPGQCPTLWSDRWLVLGETVEMEEMWRSNLSWSRWSTWWFQLLISFNSDSI